MKILITVIVLGFGWNAAAFADGTRYKLRVDGLACPFCAYGIEKKLNAIDGVDEVDIDLKNGLVTVDLNEGERLNDAQMTQLFKDAGFTYRSMTETPL